MRTFIRVVGWDRFQHYKDRNPPWIKLHRELLASNTWVSSDDASRVLAVAIMLLAAATGNQIPNDINYLRRVAYLATTPNVAPLVDVGFIEIVDEFGNIASVLQADARPEKRQRQSKRRSIQSDTPTQLKLDTPSSIPTIAHFDFFDEEFWPLYTRKQDKKKARIAYTNAIERGATHEAIMLGVRKMQASQTKPEFYPYPSTFLNGNRWEDEWGPPRKDQGAIDAIKAFVTGDIKDGFPAHDAIDRLVETVALPAPAGVVRKAGED